MIQNVLKELNRLGIHATSIGYHRIACAVVLALENEELLWQTMRLYAEVGKSCRCSAAAVERSVRESSLRAWDRNQRRLCEIAGYLLLYPPTGSEFIAILVSHTSSMV